jgi:hypothetical protein
MSTMTDAPEKKLVRRPKLNVRRSVIDFLNFDNMASRFAAQASEIKLMLRDTVLPANGDEDDRGNSWIMFEDDPIEDPAGKGDVIGIKRERRAPKTLNTERAEQFLKQRKLWGKCTETVTQVVINEDAILALAFDKTISEEELQGLYDVKENFAFVPQRRK